MDQEERLRSALADRYQIEREIGRGGMATVYLAEDLKHDRKVAVKVLNPKLAQNLGAERFLREIRTVANLTHPHILPIFDSGEADGFLYYVLPYAKGESLRSRLTKEKQLPVEDAIQITREIAGALAYAHREGVIHRDVKPANIMLEEGHAVLADFGVAHAVAEAKDERLTRTGTSLGTLAARRGEHAEAVRISEELAGIDRPFLQGSNTYWGACIAALLWEKEQAVYLLRQAHEEGVWLDIWIHTDMDLEPLRGYPAFEEFMRPKG
jgi:serine/threonine-protein kinase